MQSLTRLITSSSRVVKNAPLKTPAKGRNFSRLVTSTRSQTTRSARLLVEKFSTQKLTFSKKYTTASPFAIPAKPPQDLSPEVPHSTRPTGPDGFVRVTPTQLFTDINEGVAAIVVDFRPANEFEIYHVVGSINLPLATLSLNELIDLPKNRPVYIISGASPQNLVEAVDVAKLFQTAGASSVNIIEAGIKSFPPAGFLYYMDVDAEEARLRAIAEAEAAAKAAQQKK